MLDFIAKPLQRIIHAVKLFVFCGLVILLMVGCGLKGFLRSPVQRADIVNWLASQQSRTISDFDACTLAQTPRFNDPAYQEIDATWGLINTIRFERFQWAMGKQVPLFMAYKQAVITAEALRKGIGRIAGISPESVKVSLPKVKIAYVKELYTNGGHDSDDDVLLNNDSAVKNLKDPVPAFLVIGMCLASECRHEDFHFVNTRDLVIGPRVSPGQQRAMDALNAMQGDDFWLRTALSNGININSYQREQVLSLADVNRKVITSTYPGPSIFPPLLVFCLLLLPVYPFFLLFIALLYDPNPGDSHGRIRLPHSQVVVRYLTKEGDLLPPGEIPMDIVLAAGKENYDPGSFAARVRYSRQWRWE